MPHTLNLITTLAAGFGLALLLGFIALRLGLPALVGYLVAGIALGPATPGFVADAEMATQLAEIGVILLMFGVGLHFSLEDLKAVRRVALPGAIVQMVVATGLGYGLARFWDWSVGAALVFGMALSVASTVVLIKALEARQEANTPQGRIAIGWLVVEDLAMVLVLVLLPALAPFFQGEATADAHGIATQLLRTVAQVGGFVAFMLIVGRRLFPRLLWHVARTGSRELFTLCVVAAAVGIAYASATLFGVSLALGAFFAGMVLRESEFSQRAAEQTLPLQDAFAVLFFVAAGMLFDPRVLIEQPLEVLATLLIIIVGKTVAAIVLVLALRYPLQAALTVGASLAQIGEFSFILAALGVALGLLPEAGRHLILAAALLSIALNPLTFRLVRLVHPWLAARPGLQRWTERHSPQTSPLAALPERTDPRYLANQVILVGWNSLSQAIAGHLHTHGIPFVVTDARPDRVEHLRQTGASAVWGDPAEPEVLVQAHVRDAAVLVLTRADITTVPRVCATARTLNPTLHILICSPHADEAQRLNADQLGEVFVADELLAEAMAHRAMTVRTQGSTPDRSV